MNRLTRNVLLYAHYVYGTQILYRNRAMYVRTVEDTYYVDLRLAHEGIYRFCSITKPLVLTETYLERGVFRVAAFSSYKRANKIPTNSDWERFVNDAYKYVATMEENNV